MKSEYSKWFWSECDELNKDTNFAHSLAERAWNYRQTEVDALTLQVAEMKSRLNDAYTDGQSAMYTARQSKIDELQRRNQMLNDNIKEQGQKLVYQNEVIETQAEKLLSLRDEKAELQKRIDAVKGLAQTLWEKSEEKHQQGKVWESKTLGECADEILDVLEQALKGGSTPNLNTDENGECRHFSTTMFADGKAECFQCDAVVNEQREVIGKQSKDLHPFFKREPK